MNDKILVPRPPSFGSFLALLRTLPMSLCLTAACAVTAHAARVDRVEASDAAKKAEVTATKAEASVARAETTAAVLVDSPSTELARAVQKDEAQPASEAIPWRRRPDAERRSKFESEAERNTSCENGELHGKPCRVSWPRLLGESFFFLSAQHGGNIWMDSDTRNALTSGSFWGDYVQCVKNYRWSRWKDDDPFGVDYIGHPMMGAVTNSMYEQNDPKQRALSYENTGRYWMGRLRATAYSAAYSAQWKIGPLSEASIGNTGISYYQRHRDGVWTNETGMQDFFVTPIGGLAWNVGEDVIDRYILRHVRHGTKNKALLILSGLTTPGRSAANVSRFRAFYYRDPDVASVERERR